MTLRWEPLGPARGRVVLLHGEMSHAATWWRIGPALAGLGWDVTALDLPGHGKRPLVNRPLHMPAIVQGTSERFPGKVDVLVGHGLGAIVALVLASRYVDLTEALVLEEPPGARTEDREALADSIATDSALVHSGRDQLMRRLRLANPRWSPEDVEHAVAGMAAADVPAILAGFRAPRPWDLPTLVATLRAQALVLAAPDEPDPLGSGRLSALRGIDRLAVERALPTERFTVLPGGHHLHRDVPDLWVKTFREFVDTVHPLRDTP
ncbi:alpha/beta fold hydrolase [Actinopolymorpha sp. B17G11]|uniref:alpha/beta fold hydrolase n=1 Tax=unclassified Actinopolymorpha TaxID=2627063 RepID=UPI0032D99F4D